jgi:hypothetical protein
MHVSHDTINRLRPHFEHGGAYAPRSVVQALLTLTEVAGDWEILASVAAREEHVGITTWRVAWLTKKLVAHVEAQKGVIDWALDHGDQEHSTLTGWVERLSSLESVAVDDVTAGGHGFDTPWQWDASTALVFPDGRVLHLPLFGDRPGSDDEGRTDAFRSTALGIALRLG